MVFYFACCRTISSEPNRRAAPTAMLEIVFLRHAQSVFNASNTIQGQSDCALTSRGEAQALFAAPRVAALHADAVVVYSSDLARARMTAEPLARALRVPLLIDSRLRERACGALEGLPRRSLASREPLAHAAWASADVHARVPPNGESLADVDERLRAFAIDVYRAREGEGKVIAVTHGGALARVWAADARARRDPSPCQQITNIGECRVAVDALGEMVVIDRERWGSPRFLAHDALVRGADDVASTRDDATVRARRHQSSVLDVASE